MKRFRLRSLTLKLTLAFLLVGLTGAALVSVFIQRATQSAFDQLVLDQGQTDFIGRVTAYYESHGGWDGITETLFTRPQTQRPVEAIGDRPAQPWQRPPKVFLLVDASGRVMWPAGPYRTGDTITAEELSRGAPVTVDGQVVGRVLTTAEAPELDPREQQYLERTSQALAIAAAAATTIALLLGFLLARTLTTPLRELTSAIRAMAAGRLGQVVPVRSQDELGELTAAFNQMSADVARSNDLRRQMTADIAHDLRTPLTVITGYLESLRDGVLKPTPERLGVLHGEAQHLNRLVDDLRTLSLADANELPLMRLPTAPQAVLERAAAAYRHQASRRNIALTTGCEPGAPEVFADPDRLAQVMGNLVSNALRYTPDGGCIQLTARREGDGAVFEVRDNGAGMAPDVLPRVFERFYRGDGARPQPDGESGLGLAIAKSIVELHGGRIGAASNGPGQGSAFTIWLPCSI
jgi:signal transduction histidine kinase